MCVGSDQVKAATQNLPQYVAETPRIVGTTVDQDDWSQLGELRVDAQT